MIVNKDNIDDIIFCNNKNTYLIFVEDNNNLGSYIGYSLSQHSILVPIVDKNNNIPHLYNLDAINCYIKDNTISIHDITLTDNDKNWFDKILKRYE